MTTHAQEELLTYYLRELTYLREMGGEFAQHYPALASRLAIGDQTGTDPHVERLLEAFAFLTGRIQYNLDNEFTELPSALFNLLYPHLQAPVPSMAIAQLEMDPTQGKAAGYTVPKQTPLFVQMQNDLVCWFRTCYPVTLWPLTVSAAELVPATPHGPLLWLRLTTPPGIVLSDLPLDRLRFYLRGSEPLVSLLYELLFCHTQAIHLLPAPVLGTARPKVAFTEASRLPNDSLAPVGFGVAEEVLPYPPTAHPAYRLLQAYFAFPKKFHFFELRNLDLRQCGARFTLGLSFAKELQSGPISCALRSAFCRHGVTLAAETTLLADTQPNAWVVLEAEQPRYQIRQTEHQLTIYAANQPPATTLDIWLRFDAEALRNLEQMEDLASMVNAQTFCLGCTPIINLFEKTTEPVRINHQQTEYPLIPDVRRLSTTEIHTIERVVALTGQGQVEREVTPYYGLDHATARRNQQAFWYARRLPAQRQELAGSEMQLAFVDLSFNPRRPDEQTLYAHTLCTNRGLAEQLAPGTRLQCELPGAPLQRITCLDKPTPQVAPPLHGDTLWRLVSNLSLNHLSLTERTLFAIGLEHRAELDNATLSAALRQRFRDHNFVLSPQVTVAAAATGAGWRIVDELTGQTFTVQADAAQLSVTSGQAGLQALRELLLLYSFADRATAYDQIMGIEALTTRRIMQRMPSGWNNFSRGLEITLVLDEDRYHGRTPIVLATVLNHFFAQYVSTNLFTQLIVKSKQQDGVWKKWPPMAGEQILL